MFFRAHTFKEVREYLQGNFRLAPNSCAVTNPLNYALMATDFETGFVHYFLVDSVDQLEQGYFRVVDVDIDIVGEDDEENGVIDAIFPGTVYDPELGTMYDGLPDFARFISNETDYEGLFLNNDRRGVSSWLENQLGTVGDALTIRELNLKFPEVNVLAHFAEGNGNYSVVNVLDLLHQK